MNQDLRKALDSMPDAHQTKIKENMTSAGRLNQMLGSNSDLMKRAKTQGQQVAQSRGLLNSSMASGASQGAMIDRAQPFAMQDSNNLVSTAQRNTDARNQRGLLQAGLIGDSYKSNQNYQQQMGLNEQAYGFESDLAEQRQQFQQDNMKLGDSLQQKQMKLQNALEQGNMELAHELEQELIDKQGSVQAQRDQRLAGFDQDLQRLNAELDEARAEGNFKREKELLSQQAGITSQRDSALFDQQIELQAQQYGLQSDILKQETDAAMEKLFGSSMANAWGAMGNNITSTVARSLDAVNRIQLDPNISAENKTELIEQITSMRDADISFQKNLFETLPSQLKDTGVFPPLDGSERFSQSRLNEIYQQQLGKNADQDGTDYWRSQFDNLGWSGVEWNIKNQASAQPAVKGSAKASSSSSSSSNAPTVSRSDVMRTMQSAGGVVDSDVANSWLNRINSGQATMADLQASLKSRGTSTSQPTKAPPSSVDPNQKRLNQMYRQILGRDADAAGADYWLSQLDSIGWDGIEWNIRQQVK